MKVRVPQPTDVLDLVAADLARLGRGRAISAGAIARGATPLPEQALRLHVASHGRVRG